MSSPMVPKRLLKGMGARARRSLGQHFLKAPWVLEHILDVAALDADAHVLEIGPGLGVLTERLADTGATVVALEKDTRLVEHLRGQMGRWPNLSIIEGDALEFDFNSLPPAPSYKLVANLPYNVATPILFRVVESGLPFTDLVVMIQKEVADRILAEPGTRQYGALTVNLGMLVNSHRVVDVPPSAFHPPPKVDSTVVHLTPWPSPPGDPTSPKTFHRVVSAAFGARRKTLRNALTTRSWSRAEIDAALDLAGIDGGVRGERLSLTEFCALSRAFCELEAKATEGLP